MSIEKLLQYGYEELKKAGIKTAKLDAEVLLAFALKKTKEWLYINLGRNLTRHQIRNYNKLIERRKKYEPIAYIINHKEFYGLDFYVNKKVLIPRQETEILVEQVLQIIDNLQLTTDTKKLTIADIGTGSGCIAIVLAKHLQFHVANTLRNKQTPRSNRQSDQIGKAIKQFKQYKIYATDISKKALKVAKINAKKHKVLSKITFLPGNLLEPIKQKADIIVSNPPYVLKNEKTSKEVKYEPEIAVFIKNQWRFFIELLSQINKKLKTDGVAFIEIGNKQKKVTEEISKKIISKVKIEFIKDYADIFRLLKIKKES